MSSILFTRGGANASLDVFGPTIEFLVLPEQADSSYCVMMGTVAPGVAVPLHSHPDPESFFLISGGVQVLSERGGKLEWHDVKCSEFRARSEQRETRVAKHVKRAGGAADHSYSEAREVLSRVRETCNGWCVSAATNAG